RGRGRIEGGLRSVPVLLAQEEAAEEELGLSRRLRLGGQGLESGGRGRGIALTQEERDRGDRRCRPRRVEGTRLGVAARGLRELSAALEHAAQGELHERVLRLQ